MTARLARLSTEPSGTTDDRRRFARHPVCATATLQTAQGDPVEVFLCDVSTHGCSVHCPDGWLRGGQFVSIAIGGAADLKAIIRWVRDGAAGMEFLRPVPAERKEWHVLMG